MTVAQMPAPGADVQIVECEMPEECDLARHSTEVFGGMHHQNTIRTGVR